MLHPHEQWSPLIIKRYLNDFFCTIGDEKFSTIPTDNFDNLFRLGSNCNYENLNALNKTKILIAYGIHQAKDQREDFISLSKLERWPVKDPLKLSREWEIE
jgi:hypothetical protein